MISDNPTSPADTATVAATDIETWAVGWALARGYATPVSGPAGLWIEIGEPEQKGRHVFGRFDPAHIGAVARQITAPHVYLEIAASHEQVAPLLPEGWTFRNPAFLMAAGFSDADAPDRAPSPYEARMSELDSIIAAELRDRDGVVAASGLGATTGDCFVFDKIATHENYRRRGLGSAIMRLLTKRAVERGAAHGLLIATPDGRALYQALGWTIVSPITSVISPS